MSTTEEIAVAEAAKKKLFAKRGGHRSYATKLMNDISTVVATKCSVKLNARLKALSDRKEILIKFDQDVMDTLTTETDFEAEIEESGDYMMKIEEAIFTIAEAIEKLSTKIEEEMPGLEDSDASGDEEKKSKHAEASVTFVTYPDEGHGMPEGISRWPSF